MNFKNKTAVVLGNHGLIGSEIQKGLKRLGCKIIGFELSKNKKKDSFI